MSLSEEIFVKFESKKMTQLLKIMKNFNTKIKHSSHKVKFLETSLQGFNFICQFIEYLFDLCNFPNHLNIKELLL
jgi:hypothetical protein